MNVFLSLYILQSEDGTGAYLPFLVAAEDEDQAMEKSDTFVSEIETIADPTSTRREIEDARASVEMMHADICLVEDPKEIAFISKIILGRNPNFEADLVAHIGGVFTVAVNTETGFPADASKALRGRLYKHRLVNSLSVDLV